MKALITGAGGQIGQALSARPPAGSEVISMTHAELDISDADAVASAVERIEPDLIINAAAYTDVDQAESDPETACEANEIGPANLAEAAAAVDARLIHISTDFVFDGRQSAAYRPGDTPAPLSVYGTTKLAGERAILSWLPNQSVVLRTAWVYSATGSNFMRTMLRLMRETGEVSVVADQIGSPTSAASVAAAIWALATNSDCHGIFHWTDAGVASWYDFAVAIAEEACAQRLLEAMPAITPITIEDYPTPAQRPRFSVLDSRTTTEATGLKRTHWRANLRTVLAEVARG